MMGPFVSYMLQVSLVMTLLYLAYKWLLSTSTFHTANRVVLLSIYAVSWMLPGLLRLYRSFGAVDNSGMSVIGDLTAVGMVQTETAATFDWWRLLLWIYAAGVVVAAVAALAGVYRMITILRSGEHVRHDGYTEVVTDLAPGPFSWWKYIVMRQCDTGEAHAMVTAHECAHLWLRHWLDLIPAQLTAILQWFSPAAWLMMRELKDVHEYQVDALVAGANPAAYQIMLLKMTVGSSFPVLADSLNHSQIKKRLTMMMTKKSSPSRRVAALALPAVAALAVFTLSQPMVARVIDNIASATVSDVLADKISKSEASVQIAGLSGTVAAITRNVPVEDSNAEAMAEATAGSDNASESSVDSKTEPAESKNTEVAEKKPATFVDGKLFTGELRSIPSDEIASMYVIKDDPAYPEGKIMVVTKSAVAKQNEGKLYLKPADIAEFDGGQASLMQFIVENIKYPAEMKNIDKTVRVIVQFTITPQGGVSEARIVKGAPKDMAGGEAFDNEALRVVKLTGGHWKAAQNDGVPVASQFTLPITFKSK